MTSKPINDGGPAFPHSMEQYERGTEGMTLRDYFAAKAMQGELASQSVESGLWRRAEGLAERAYVIADAMLAARESSNG